MKERPAERPTYPSVPERLRDINEELQRIVEMLWDLEHRRQGSMVYQQMRRISSVVEDVEAGVYERD